MNKEELRNKLETNLATMFQERLSDASEEQILKAFSSIIMENLSNDWMRTKRAYAKTKQACYLSMEYLVGRSFTNNLINLNMYEATKELLNELEIDSIDITEKEKEPPLGTGGLGRLAACFMDSAATLNMPLTGYGLRFKNGYFKQSVDPKYDEQREITETWLNESDIFQVRKQNDQVLVKMKDLVVLAVPYDMPVTGYNTKNINTIRLWQAEAPNEFDVNKLNADNYAGAVKPKNDAEKLTRCIYPNNEFESGKLLRMQQEYFLCSATMQDVLRKHNEKYNNFAFLNNYLTFQLNDTHPVFAIPEFIRLLVDRYEANIDVAIEMAKQCFNFTNHTILPEASEVFNKEMLKEQLPRIYEIIEYINSKLVAELDLKGVCAYNEKQIDASIIVFDDVCPRAKTTFDQSDYEIINKDSVRMQNLAIYIAKTINGVSKVHTGILKEKTLNHWFRLYPNKFINITNGITQRRWLVEANSELSDIITKNTGSEKWKTRLENVNVLQTRINDVEFLNEISVAKMAKKRQLADYIYKEYGEVIDTNSLIEVQAKRVHEYKRQLLTILYVRELMNRIKNNPDLDVPKITFIFAGKAYPTYKRAKAVIKLIMKTRAEIDENEELSKKLKVFYLPDYNVAKAEILLPAADVSLQVSTAGTEASGTGNMKLMANGAITVGTEDGANIEIFDRVGEGNYYKFGLTARQIDDIKETYKAVDVYSSDSSLKKVIDDLNNYEDEDIKNIYNSLVLENDQYFVLKDFASFRKIQDKVFSDFDNKVDWTKKSLNNITNSGYFSSDRTLKQYMTEIWDLNGMKIK